MTSFKFDVAIVGGGIIGTNVGIALLQAEPKLKVVILEKEKSLGLHASGRNSGVLHAGFYYSPDSLKARFCKEGNIAIRNLCKRHNLPILECGKVVVTQNEKDETQIEKLFERGLSNGIDISLLDAKELPKYEPLARTHKRFIWSPNSAVADPKAIIEILQLQFRELGGEIKVSKRISFSFNEKVTIDDSDFEAKYFINTAGAYADDLAKKIGLAEEYSMIPFAGIYRFVSTSSIPLKTLVYPVPHPINPFLGVHFTKTVDNFVKIGPTAIPVFGREQYQWNQGWSYEDFKELVKGSFSIIKGDSHDFSKMISSEWPKIIQSNLINESAKLIPSAKKVKGWKKKPPGIRSQLVNRKTGKLEQDFIVKNFANSTHVLNAVSPGWTCAIPFGKYIVEKFVLTNLN